MEGLNRGQNKIKLIKERKKRGWSQEFVARTSGCSREYYNRLENGIKHNPKANVIKNLANLFSVSADELLRWLEV